MGSEMQIRRPRTQISKTDTLKKRLTNTEFSGTTILDSLGAKSPCACHFAVNCILTRRYAEKKDEK